MADWKDVLRKEWQDRQAIRLKRRGSAFPLVGEEAVEYDDIESIVEVILDARLTMGSEVREFEQSFADELGVEGAVMVNSGSSASLLAVSVACNPLRKRRLAPGDEVLVPAVCWPASLWPLVLYGLKPKFVDVDPATLNVDIDRLEEAITSRTRGVMAVHILGNSAPMDRLMAVVEKHDLMLIEDTCESLGSVAFGKPLGTHGEFGLYSFYYSHHITTGEGGAVTCRDPEDLELLRCLRTHGWSRALSNRKRIESANPEIDSSFLFCNSGFNLKPMELQGAMGRRQLNRLNQANANRISNYERMREALYSHRSWSDQLQLPKVPSGTSPVWFGFPFLLAPGYRSQRSDYSRWLKRNDIEHRPIVTGNVARHPVSGHLGMSREPSSYPGAEAVHSGFFIGIHSRRLDAGEPESLADVLLGYEFH